MTTVEEQTVRGDHKVGEAIMIDGKPVRITRVHQSESYSTSCVSGFIIPSVKDRIAIRRLED